MQQEMELLYQPCDICLNKQSPELPTFDDKVWQEAVRKVFQEGGFHLDMLSGKEARALIEETHKVLSKAVDYSIHEETPQEMVEALKDNAYIFSGFKTYHSLKEVGLSMTDSKGRIKSFQQFSEEVKAIDSKYNKRYLEAEYQHAIASSQMAARWAELSDNEERYLLQYRSAKDNKVRSEHQAIDDTTLPKSDPFWTHYYPPNGWGCRCHAIEVLKRDYPKSNSDEALARAKAITNGKHQELFRFNAGIEKRLFPDKHPYFGKKGISHCNTSTRLTYQGENPCKVLGKVLEAQEKSKSALERAKYLGLMKRLLKISKVKEIGDNKKIKVGFTTRGNQHLYSDTFGRSKVLQKDDLEELDKILEEAVYLDSSSLTHPQKGGIDHFHYFSAKLRGKLIRLNVAERSYRAKNKFTRREYFLYSINDIKK